MQIKEVKKGLDKERCVYIYISDKIPKNIQARMNFENSSIHPKPNSPGKRKVMTMLNHVLELVGK